MLTTRLLQGSIPTDRVEFFTHHIRPSERPWSFEGHEYLRGPLQDDAPYVVFQKAAQVGASTLSIGTLLHWCLMGRKAGYYLSDRDFMTAFVQDRVDPLINADPDIAQATLDGKGGEALAGSAWFMGLQKRKDVKSLDLDAFILDEVDEVDQSLAVWLNDRVLHSQYKRRIELSQPSVPDWGISERYAVSDQKVWMHRCPRCRSWHCLEDEWPTNFRVRPTRGKSTGIPEILCLKCDARLITPKTRCEWVARHPEREISGYRISQLYGPAMNAKELHDRWQPTARSRDKLENFTISILGLPFPGDRQPLSEQVLTNACADWPLGVDPYVQALNIPRDETRPLIVSGIDQGDLLHLLIGVVHEELTAIVWAEVIADDWDLLARRLLENRVDFFVVDALPNKSNAKKLVRADQLNGAISYLNAQAFSWRFEEAETVRPIRVMVDDRTTAIDDMAFEVVGGQIMFPSPRLDATQLLKRHCKALVKDRNPQTGRDEYKRNVENHFGMALTSLRHARQLAIQLGLGPRQPIDPETSAFGGPIAAQIW